MLTVLLIALVLGLVSGVGLFFYENHQDFAIFDFFSRTTTTTVSTLSSGSSSDSD